VFLRYYNFVDGVIKTDNGWTYSNSKTTFQWEFEQFWLFRKLLRRVEPSYIGGTTSGWRPRPCSTSSRPPPRFRPCRPRSTMPTSCVCWCCYCCCFRTLFQHFQIEKSTFFLFSIYFQFLLSMSKLVKE